MKNNCTKLNTKSWQNQIDTWNLAKKKSRDDLTHDMGAFDSKTTVDFATGIDARKILIKYPKKVIDVGVWQNQFKTRPYSRCHLHAPFKCTVKQKADSIKRHLKQCEFICQIFIVTLNHDIFWLSALGAIKNDAVRTIKDGILADTMWDLLITDEVHLITPRRQDALVSETALKLLQSMAVSVRNQMAPSQYGTYGWYRALSSKIFGPILRSFKDAIVSSVVSRGRQVIAGRLSMNCNKSF